MALILYNYTCNQVYFHACLFFFLEISLLFFNFLLQISFVTRRDNEGSVVTDRDLNNIGEISSIFLLHLIQCHVHCTCMC